MTTPVQASLREAVDPKRLRDHLEWFSRVRRDTGGPGEERAVEYIVEQLREAGVPVRSTNSTRS